MVKEKVGFVTPGEILLEEFLKPLGISASKLALEIKVPASRIYEIINDERAITADTDLRFAKYFGISEGFWLGLQADHDMDIAREKIEGELETIRRSEKVLRL